LKRAISQSDETIDKAAEMINDAYGVFFVACGSSYHAALASSYIFSKVAKKHINVVDASEFRYYLDFITPKTLVIAISQSGETADVLDAVKTAKKKKARIMAITNVMGSSLMRLADFTILMNCGPEICVVATKSYTAQLAILLLLAYAIIGKKETGKEVLKKAADSLDILLSSQFLKKIESLAERMKDKEHIFCIGRGVSHATALEAALKIKEVTYLHAEGFAGGALKHGNIALIENGTPCIVFAPNDETYDEIISNAMEVKSRGGWIIGVSPKNHEVFEDWINVPDLDFASSVVNVVPIQYLSYRIAVLRGLNPDKPRNLAKSVTVK
jgi:glucosamine--fructose-6-phosphate aminotransferase (isomerizing)